MSQEQPRRPGEGYQDPDKHGDVLLVSGDLAKESIAPEDAIVMQTPEATVIGQVQPGGPGVVMGGTAVVNERIELDDRGDATGGKDVISYAQVVGQYYQTPQAQWGTGGATTVRSKITIGEALEAAARVIGDKPVDRSNAAAIHEAEAIVTGGTVITPCGVADMAISAAEFNAGVDNEEDKIKLSYVLAGATAKLPESKAVTREDADRVASAEQRNSPNLTANPAGVAVSLATAARLNEGGA